MNRNRLEEYIQKLQREAPEIINAIYASLDHHDIVMTKETVRERTGLDMTDMSVREDALLPIIIIKTLSGIPLTEEEKCAVYAALAFRKARFEDGEWRPGLRWNGNGFSTDREEDYPYA
jgi:hypothetical protein